MDPTAFFHFALGIIASGPAPDPATCRTAIGRAYYAALNRADEALARWGASCGKGPQKHGLAVRFLHATNDPDLMLASAHLNDLKTSRNRADYDMSDASVEKASQARKALDLAKKVMDSLEAVDNNPARRASAENQIRSYQQKTRTP
jgi:hypothetical protein